jgi:hypothetical protein
VQRSKTAQRSKLNPTTVRRLQSPCSPSFTMTTNDFTLSLLDKPHGMGYCAYCFLSAFQIQYLTTAPRALDVTETIQVNLKLPESNNPFYIYEFTNQPMNATLHNGFHIELKGVDFRWMLDGTSAVFSAWQVSGNEILVAMPSMCYDYLKNDTVEDEAKTKANYLFDRILEEDKVVRNALLGDPKRHTKYYKLVFPVDSDNGLKNDIFSPNADNGKLSVKVTAKEALYAFEHPTAGDMELKFYTVDLIWDIAITEETARKVQAAAPMANELATQLSNLLGGMQI